MHNYVRISTASINQNVNRKNATGSSRQSWHKHLTQFVHPISGKNHMLFKIVFVKLGIGVCLVGLSHDQRPEMPVHLVMTCMRMVELGSRFGGFENVPKRCWKLNRTLSYERHTVHVRGVALMQSVPMHGRGYSTHLIGHIDDHQIVFANLRIEVELVSLRRWNGSTHVYRRTRHFSIDAHHPFLHTIGLDTLLIVAISQHSFRTLSTGTGSKSKSHTARDQSHRIETLTVPWRGNARERNCNDRFSVLHQRHSNGGILPPANHSHWPRRGVHEECSNVPVCKSTDDRREALSFYVHHPLTVVSPNFSLRWTRFESEKSQRHKIRIASPPWSLSFRATFARQAEAMPIPLEFIELHYLNTEKIATD